MKNKKSMFSLTNRENAVSEAIGFILIFSLVMVGIGLITLYGYPILLEQQSNANVKNMERDMIVLQNDMKSLVYKNAPYKETSLQVSGGALAVHGYSLAHSSMIIELNGTSIVPEYRFGQLLYESDAGESIIALENGAVLTRMEFQNGSAMLAEPRWFIDNNTVTGDKTMIITLVNIISDNPISRNGIGTVKMQMLPPEPQIMNDTGGRDVIITYTRESGKFDFITGWDNYVKSFDSELMGVRVAVNHLSPDVSQYTVRGIDTVIIKKYEIKIISI